MRNLLSKNGMFGRIVGLGIIILLLTACGAQSLPEQFDEETVKAEAEKAIGYFNEHDYQSILDMSTDEFQEAITVEEFASQCDPYHERCGEYQGIDKTIVLGNIDKETQKAYGGVVMVGGYEKGTIQFTIGFDEDMKIIQFIIK